VHKEKTEWHRASVFSEGLCKIAEQHVEKGAKVYVEGQLETRKWTDQAGQQRHSTKVLTATAPTIATRIAVAVALRSDIDSPCGKTLRGVHGDGTGFRWPSGAIVEG
jgi:single stranded DNA-binding protein